MNCRYCPNQALSNGITCGDSYCQEEDYYTSMYKNARGARQKEHWLNMIRGLRARVHFHRYGRMVI